MVRLERRGDPLRALHGQRCRRIVIVEAESRDHDAGEGIVLDRDPRHVGAVHVERGEAELLDEVVDLVGLDGARGAS